MAKTQSLSIYLQDGTTLDELKEVMGEVVENIQTGCVSEAIKNKQGSGNPEAGSVIYKRFVNAELKQKGTARAAGAGAKVKDANVIINIDDNKEIIEELQQKDIKLFGIAGMARRRMTNFQNRVKAYLDRKFFTYAKSVGTKVTTTKTAVVDIVDELILKAKETQSDFIDGIDAEDLCLVVDGAYRKELKDYLDSLPTSTTKPQNGQIGVYDSVDTYESNRLPQGVRAFVMLKGAIAFPNYLSEYDAEKVPFDDAIALEAFLYNGIGALNKEAIVYHED